MESDRPTCSECLRPAAINYHKDGKVHYRSLCVRCLHPRKLVTTAWMRAGYTLKKKCDMCGFERKYAKQMVVLYVDGDQKNGDWPNLKSVCANCVIEISIKGLGWKEDDVKPDF